MSRFYKDWDEVKKILEETPATKEREEIFARSLKSMAAIKENLKTIQQELFFWPKFKKFLYGENVIKYILFCVVCLIGLLSVIGLVDLTTTSGHNNPFHQSYVVIGAIIGFTIYCIGIRQYKDRSTGEEFVGFLIPAALAGAFWPILLGGACGYYALYNLGKFIQEV